MMTDEEKRELARQAYDRVLDAFCAAGGRWSNLPDLTKWGKLAGQTPEEIICDANARGVTDRDADILRLWNGSTVLFGGGSSPRCKGRRDARAFVTAMEREENRRALLPNAARSFVPSVLLTYWTNGENPAHGTTNELLARLVADEDETLRFGEVEYRRQAAAQLRACYAADEIVWAGFIDATGKTAFDGRKGGGIVGAHELAEMLERGRFPVPTHVSLNPLTGTAGLNAVGRLSHDCLATVKAWRHVLLEWDALKNADGTPSQEGIDVAAGLIDYAAVHPETLRVVSVTYTGGKSLHAVLRVADGGKEKYKRAYDDLRDLCATADEPRFRADLDPFGNGSPAIKHVRLAGAKRPETGRRQRLAWLG